MHLVVTYVFFKMLQISWRFAEILFNVYAINSRVEFCTCKTTAAISYCNCRYVRHFGRRGKKNSNAGN